MRTAATPPPPSNSAPRALVATNQAMPLPPREQAAYVGLYPSMNDDGRVRIQKSVSMTSRRFDLKLARDDGRQTRARPIGMLELA